MRQSWKAFEKLNEKTVDIENAALGYLRVYIVSRLQRIRVLVSKMGIKKHPVGSLLISPLVIFLYYLVRLYKTLHT